VDFISNNGESVVLRTSPEEAGKVVFQVGTADAVHALQAAQQVCVTQAVHRYGWEVLQRC
jgi:tRNA-dihydrouridine synthase 2